jgi:hypothetical protein
MIRLGASWLSRRVGRRRRLALLLDRLPALMAMRAEELLDHGDRG